MCPPKRIGVHSLRAVSHLAVISRSHAAFAGDIPFGGEIE
jgi:hypothetical protein